MRRIRVYVHPSVFGATQDDEFAEPSRRFFERVKAGEFTVLVSAHTVDELQLAPEQVRQVLADLPDGCVERVTSGEEVEQLGEAYIEAGALGKGAAIDARHVAAASVAGADLILSWNFKHIVCFERIRIFNGVNVLKGYRTLDIRSPLEMEYGDQEQDV